MCVCIWRGAGLMKLLFFCVFSFTLLSLNFYTNFLGSAEQNWFKSFDRDSERVIMGRLIKSRQDGIFSFGGLYVFGVTNATVSKDPFYFFNDKFDNYDAYINNFKVEHFSPPYYSQICGQGILLSVLDKIIPYSPAIKLRLFHGLASLLTALILTAIIAWFSVEFGFFAGLTVLIFALLSQWLTVFGKSLWWFTWAFYLPMAMVMLYFRYTPKKRLGRYLTLGSIVFFSILIKTVFNGYEYITTTLIMMMVPFVYYNIFNKVSFAVFLHGLIKIAISAGLAIAVSLCILSFQIASVSGNFLDGVHHVIYSLEKRTHANSANPNHQFAASNIEGLKAPALSVILNYLHGGFCGIDSNVFNLKSSEPHARYYLSYARLILLFAVMTLVLYLSDQRCASRLHERTLALILASWFSILAPLSWIIIFKAHSYSHLHLNMIIWQMPFTFFGAAITGLAIKNSFSRLISARRCTYTTG
jgi:hypothetical protein